MVILLHMQRFHLRWSSKEMVYIHLPESTRFLRSKFRINLDHSLIATTVLRRFTYKIFSGGAQVGYLGKIKELPFVAWLDMIALCLIAMEYIITGSRGTDSDWLHDAIQPFISKFKIFVF